MSAWTNNDIRKLIGSLDKIAKVLETANSNLVLLGRDLVPPQTESLQPCKLEVGQRICNMDKTSFLYLHEGQIVRMDGGGVFVHYDGFEFPSPSPVKNREHLGVLDDDVSYENHVCGGPEYCVVCRDAENMIKDANELQIPALVDDAKIGPDPSDSYEIHQMDGTSVLKRFTPDKLGQMYPSEWRHNLGINNIRVMKPNAPKLFRNENAKMNQLQFEAYNTELYATGVIMNEEDAEGTPDDRGRLKPYEWRHKFDMPQIDPGRGQAHAFDENRLMTEDTFWAYHALLNASGTKGLDSTVVVEGADESWKGDF